MAACNMHTKTATTRVLAALLLLLLLPAAMPVSLASVARSNTPTPPPPAPPAPATDGLELREVSSVTGVLVKKVAASSKVPGAAMSGRSRPLPPASLVSRHTLAAIKLIPPSGPSEGSDNYSFQPPPA
ncbi:unnamed protein product [Urochloa humidicola]